MADQRIDADKIAANANAPQSVTDDTGSMSQHSIPDQIAADRYAKSSRAARRGLGFRMVKMIPPAPGD